MTQDSPQKPDLFSSHARSLEDDFYIFHRRNPRVYETLVRLARVALGRGRRRLGIGVLWEAMRWEMYLDTDGEEYRLNNSYRSRYARLLMSCESDLEGVFETRGLRS